MFNSIYRKAAAPNVHDKERQSYIFTEGTYILTYIVISCTAAPECTLALQQTSKRGMLEECCSIVRKLIIHSPPLHNSTAQVGRYSPQYIFGLNQTLTSLTIWNIKAK